MTAPCVSLGLWLESSPKLTYADRHAQQIVFLMTLLDTNGAFVTGKEALMDLALTDAKLASLEREGLKAVATLTAPAGK